MSYLRSWSLTVTNPGGGAGLVLSQNKEGFDLRLTFKILAADVQSPNHATIRVYNLSDQTVKQVIGEFSYVVLNAGYEDGEFGVIFQGDIKQFRHGRESNIDTFLDIMTSDGDLAHIFGTVNATIAQNASPQDQLKVIGDSFKQHGVTLGDTAAVGVAGILPRGKVLFGLARDQMRNLTNTAGSSWSIQNGKVTVVPLDSYLPGEAVVLTAYTGLIGVPEATDGGIYCKCLLNPRITIGTRIQLANGSVTATDLKSRFGFPDYTSLSYVAATDLDGFYRTLVVEYEGDTRGDPWWCNLVVLAINPSAQPGAQVQPYG